MLTPGYNAVPVCTEDRDGIYMEEDNSMLHEAKIGPLSGSKASIPCAKLITSCYKQVE